MPLRGRNLKYLMINSKIDVFFNEIGLSDPEDQAVVLNFMDELFSITLEHYNNYVQTTTEDAL